MARFTQKVTVLLAAAACGVLLGAPQEAGAASFSKSAALTLVAPSDALTVDTANSQSTPIASSELRYAIGLSPNKDSIKGGQTVVAGSSSVTIGQLQEGQYRVSAFGNQTFGIIASQVQTIPGVSITEITASSPQNSGGTNIMNNSLSNFLAFDSNGVIKVSVGAITIDENQLSQDGKVLDAAFNLEITKE